MSNFGITQEEALPKLVLHAEAQAWLDEFMGNNGSKKDDLSRPGNFHVNMTYVLSTMFYAEPDQPATMEGNYLATKPMTAHVSVKKVGKEESGRANLLAPTRKEPERVYIDRIVFSRPSLTLANHLKPIYATSHMKGVHFKRILIDGGVAVNVLPFKQMKRVCRSGEDLIPTDLTISSFFLAITKTHWILPLEVDLGSKQIMLALFDVDSTSTYGVLLG
ncbi:hypothetical protein ACFX1X_013327 [Malus domestica]